MIKKFDCNTALLVIDAQKGVNDTNYYGGAKGKRNNLNAEKNIISILKSCREKKRQVVFTLYDSRENGSPLKLSKKKWAVTA